MGALDSVLKGYDAGRQHKQENLLQGLRGEVSGQMDDGSFTTGSKAFNKLMLEDPRIGQIAQRFNDVPLERKRDYFEILQRIKPMVARGDLPGAMTQVGNRIKKMEEYNANPQNLPADTSMSQMLMQKLQDGNVEEIGEGIDYSLNAAYSNGILEPPLKKAKPTAFEEMQEVYASGNPKLIDMYNQKNKLGDYSVGDKSTKEKFDRSLKMRGEVKAASQEFLKIQSAHDRITAVEDTPAGDLALIFNFMKMLDPGSTVREGEFATAAGAASVPERLKGVYNQIMEGTRLTPDQRTDFLGQTNKLFGASTQRHNKKMSGFIRVAARFGLAAEDIIANPLTDSGFKILSVD